MASVQAFLKTVESTYPLHWLVWNNKEDEILDLLENQSKACTEMETPSIEQLDPRGRTPLQLATTLGHLECAKRLLEYGARTSAENPGQWTVLHEAICTGDPEMVSLILKHDRLQHSLDASEGIPALLNKLRESPDFYVEMRWEFSSWLPFVARMCPHDTYRIWKSGSNLRIDTTLLGFDNMRWQRGNVSFIFKTDAHSATLIEVNHERKWITTENIENLPVSGSARHVDPSPSVVASKMSVPAITIYLDMNKISFERSKSGIWGWRSDKSEDIEGYQCKVFQANNVEVVTKTRMEHLSAKDREEWEKFEKESRSPLENFIGRVEEETVENAAHQESRDTDSKVADERDVIAPEEYFNPNIELGFRDIGKRKVQTTKIQKFKAHLSLCEDFPLQLQEQVLPVIDLMAEHNAHFKKLKEFIALQLPAGFPVKVEIPLFHVLKAKITFTNVQASQREATGVSCLRDGDSVFCAVDESVFTPPSHYRICDKGDYAASFDENVDEDALLCFAIQQSMLEEQGTAAAVSIDDSPTDIDTVVAQRRYGTDSSSAALLSRYSNEDIELQRVLEQSFQEQLALASQNSSEDDSKSRAADDKQLVDNGPVSANQNQAAKPFADTDSASSNQNQAAAAAAVTDAAAVLPLASQELATCSSAQQPEKSPNELRQRQQPLMTKAVLSSDSSLSSSQEGLVDLLSDNAPTTPTNQTASLADVCGAATPLANGTEQSFNGALERALDLSRKESDMLKEMEKREQEELEMVLRLSLEDK